MRKRQALYLATISILWACSGATGDTRGPSSDTQPLETTRATPAIGEDAAAPAAASPDTHQPGLDTTLPESDSESTDVPPAEPEVDVAPAPDPPTETVLKAVITAPASGLIVEIGEPVPFIGVVTDSYYEAEEIQVVWSTGAGEVIQDGPAGAAGWTQGEVAFDAPGEATLILTATNPNGQAASASVDIGVCTWGEPETFSEALSTIGWTVYGDAFWEPQGWLEMTGNAGGKKGAIFNTGAFVNPGDVTISFSIWTGEGINTGADGFAMSVVNTKTVEELETFIDEASAGGCLGYGVSGPCGGMAVDAFHIEFDTWHNGGDPNTDPTPGNHVAITLNGDPGDHLLWADMNEVENSGVWHQVEIDIDGSTVTVNMDGTNKLTGVIPDFNFHGGFIGFSGTTGWATNFHRFDNLYVQQGCNVPTDTSADL